ncbi:MAG: transposase [Verrucomicrobiales bacterium]|nr:transposase [Akkermansiaceae bacterium]MCP5554225.1 transposase [Akkermansiaceae bacterium]
MPKTKPPYSEEFRREAVDLYVSSGRSLKGVAEDLGVSTNSLRSWKQALLGGSAGRGPAPRERGEDPAGADPEQMAEEIRRLRRENEHLRRQREILKKAASILAEDPQAGMR